MSASIWISNSGMDRGLELRLKNILNVDTWHGTPFKTMGEDIKSNEGVNFKAPRKRDSLSIRCAQSEYDRAIFERLFNADKSCFLICDLPRNDSLFSYTTESIAAIRKQLGIDDAKKVILYTPTFRDYAWDAAGENYIKPPIDLEKWERALGGEYVLLFRAHYAVTAALNLQENAFVKDVSNYPLLNDLYAIADLMISDYSSTFFDYAILDRPMLCFAYDFEEYSTKRGVYQQVVDDLPCPIMRSEDQVISGILNMDYDEYASKTAVFHRKYAPKAGQATQAVVNEIISRLG